MYIFIFLFRTSIRKRYLDESDFRHCYGNFFESAILKVTWSQQYSKFFLNNCEVHWQQHFERHPTVEDFTDMDQDMVNSITKTWVNIIKRKSTKVPWKLSLAKKYDPTLQRTLHQSRWYFFFSQTSLAFKSNPVFIDILDSFCHSLFTFLPLIVGILRSLNFIQCL